MEATFFYLPPEKMLISWYPGKEDFEGKTLKDIAQIRGKSPSECYAEMVSEKKCPMGIFFLMDMATVREIMPWDYIITASDGWATAAVWPCGADGGTGGGSRAFAAPASPSAASLPS